MARLHENINGHPKHRSVKAQGFWMRKDNEDIHYSGPKQRCFKGTVRSPKLHRSRVDHSGRSLALAVRMMGDNPCILRSEVIVVRLWLILLKKAAVATHDIH